MKQYIIVGLDIGTYSLKMGVAKVNEKGSLEMIGFAEELSSGVRKGSVIKPEEVTSKIVSVKQRIENLSSQKVHQVVVNVGGSHMFVTYSHGIVAVSRADGQISQEDVDRVLLAAQVFSLPSNKEILEVFPQQFIVDGEEKSKEPSGMKGVRLEADVLAICAFSPYVKNVIDAVLGANLEVADRVPSALMAASVVLTNQQKELGVLLIDLGAGTTNIAVFEEGDVIHAAVFPVGSENITNDIAIGLRTEYAVAERVKKEFGILGISKGKRIEKIEIGDSESLSFSPKQVTHIIEARLHEIFQFVAKELKKIERQGKLPGGIVFVGGGAKLPKLAEFTKKEFKLPTKIGSPHGIVTFETDPAFLGVMGLIGHSFLFDDGHMAYKGSSSGFWGKMKKIFKVFIP